MLTVKLTVPKLGLKKNSCESNIFRGIPFHAVLMDPFRFMSKRPRQDAAHAPTAARWHIGRRVSIMSFNVWRGEDGGPALWPQRKHTIVQMLRHFRPDILCIQEGHPTIQAAIREALPNHHSVTPDIDADPCWANESNIFWHSGLFHRVAGGAIDVNISASRKLCWTKLALNDGQNAPGSVGKIAKTD